MCTRNWRQFSVGEVITGEDTKEQESPLTGCERTEVSFQARLGQGRRRRERTPDDSFWAGRARRRAMQGRRTGGHTMRVGGEWGGQVGGGRGGHAMRGRRRGRPCDGGGGVRCRRERAGGHTVRVGSGWGKEGRVPRAASSDVLGLGRAMQTTTDGDGPECLQRTKAATATGRRIRNGPG